MFSLPKVSGNFILIPLKPSQTLSLKTQKSNLLHLSWHQPCQTSALFFGCDAFTVHETTAPTWQPLQILTFQINRCNAAWAKTAQTAAGLGPDQRGFSSAAWLQIRTDDVISPHRGHTLDYVKTCLVLGQYIEQQVIWGRVAVLRLTLCSAGTPMLGLQVYLYSYSWWSMSTLGKYFKCCIVKLKHNCEVSLRILRISKQ